MRNTLTDPSFLIVTFAVWLLGSAVYIGYLSHRLKRAAELAELRKTIISCWQEAAEARLNEQVKLRAYQTQGRRNFRDLLVCLWGNPPLPQRHMGDILRAIEELQQKAAKSDWQEREIRLMHPELKQALRDAEANRRERIICQRILKTCTEKGWTFDNRSHGAKNLFAVLEVKESKMIAEGATLEDAFAAALTKSNA